MLNHFGYSMELQIKRNLWDDDSISEEVLRTTRSFELTKEAITYLRKLFAMFSYKNEQLNAQVLDLQGFEKIFATCHPEDGLPFDPKSETQFDGGLSCELWIGLWQKLFCERPKIAFKFLVYTGFNEGSLKEVIKPIVTRTKDILGQGN